MSFHTHSQVNSTIAERSNQCSTPPLAHLMESSCQPIITGLPDDIALRCLAKISHGYHGSLETVSKRWRDVLHSTEYSNFKAKEGLSGDWVFLLTENRKDQWIAYDPDADRWHPMPMIPRKDGYARSEGFGCVCIGNRFFVIGGAIDWTNPTETDESPFITNQVFQFDTFTKEWSEAASMRTPRAYFGCCVMSGKVYVCGGQNMSHSNELASAEVYDPLINKWEEVPQTRDSQMDCLSLSYNGHSWVLSDLKQGNYTQLGQYKTYDLSRRVWRTEQRNDTLLGLLDRSNWDLRTEQMIWYRPTFGQATVQLIEDGRMYADVHVDEGKNLVKAVDYYEKGGEWNVVAQMPSVGSPDGHSRVTEVHEYGFVALGNELFVMGGVVVCQDDTEPTPSINFLNFDRGWIWDGKWRQTRRMCRPFSGGVVKVFAAFKEKKKKMSTTSS